MDILVLILQQPVYALRVKLMVVRMWYDLDKAILPSHFLVLWVLLGAPWMWGLIASCLYLWACGETTCRYSRSPLQWISIRSQSHTEEGSILFLLLYCNNYNNLDSNFRISVGRWQPFEGMVELSSHLPKEMIPTKCYSLEETLFYQSLWGSS